MKGRGSHWSAVPLEKITALSWCALSLSYIKIILTVQRMIQKLFESKQDKTKSDGDNKMMNRNQLEI